MPEIVLDCQNLQCPQPVIQAKRLLEKEKPALLKVIVDNEPALENVNRFLSSQGYSVSHAKKADTWHIQAKSSLVETQALSEKSPSIQAVLTHPEETKTLVMIISPVFGSGDDQLGGRLMKNFISTLPEMGSSLWRIVLLNGGVTLATGNSPVIEELRKLEDSGVSILVCGTCLEHFGILAQKAVGVTTNMLDVVTSAQLADKVIRI